MSKMIKCAYIDNTRTDTRDFHAAIMEAIKNGGIFGEDLADVFRLTKTPAGSAAEYSLDFA